jgi:glycosyltransferase involved in cell wall biosynthesis
LRVLILNYEFPPLGGGAGNATYELVRELGAVRDIEVVVVTSSVADYEVKRHTLTPNSVIHCLPIGKDGGNIHYQTNAELVRYNLKCYAFLNGPLRGERFDLCHAIMTLPAGINAWWIRKRVPYIVSLQGSDVPGYSERFALAYKGLTPIIRRIWRDSLGVISNSVALRDLAVRAAPQQLIDVITNGIDRSLFSAGERAHDPAKLRIICVGRLIERKGVWELLEALPQVLTSIPNAHLDLVGTGILEQGLRERIAAMGLEDHVTLHGAVDHDQLPVLLREAALFALPSHAEGMSNALLEGISCGLPIVVTDTGGTSELLDGNGLVIPMRDPAALGAAIVHILGSPEQRTAMCQASLGVADRYSWEAMGRQYLDYYHAVTQSKIPAAAAPVHS